ncbi:MAG: hypothetical protein A2275_01955 [Bacteroidetes bacterium RIFOXYA12_FULL_35_11]|nr:MAG: hypothetical protein A2X01_16390 [Bacteroidetes bacterium GWF2_35_48]OFY75339.1 MAG: hypothetical protein A2275_01955 [Bacteroidetes bacterium RIFOXYA12_FULL_35_11]OFY94071.1 MAG: hypothetical protein A2491_17150 [Bacteroidetes bacterium RIFOXYC12_FULL_35_7]OFY96803.1 MAG: hypothetical protein A2309_04730 [Bacteroidetes bacterium RIFOXYB2_FULL_35_7]HBX53459.1 hypothetical protein [Bacteroidales bacterium]
MKKIIKLFFGIIALVVILFLIFLGYSMLTNYDPQDREEIFKSENPNQFKQGDTLRFLIWNIGYAGLGGDMDFFYDGGKNMQTSKERTLENFVKIKSLLAESDSIDFIMLQEVDVEAKRSYYINERDSLSSFLIGWKPYFAMNYNVKFVPSPISSPMGKVISGILSLTKHEPLLCERYKFPGEGPFPTNLFMLDRCFIVKRFPVSENKQLLVINTHNAAFEDSVVKTKHMEFLKGFLSDEYSKGNYIIMGGDWNQSPFGADKNSFSKSLPEKHFKLISIAKDFLPKEWKWIYDPTVPTNRYLNFPYDPETTPKIIIDYYLISPNVDAVYVHTKNLDFQNSDHQPVFAGFVLK